jgi:hypothetical protein
MGRLYTIVSLGGLAFYLMSAAGPVAAQDYCSLHVRVRTPSGQRLEVPVEVREKNGRKTEKEQTPTVDVSFCDLGILPVTVVVGIEGCNQVVITDVPLKWKQPYTLKVTYDVAPCMDHRVPSPTPYCEVLLRVMGSDGKWIGNATVNFDDPSRPQLHTDSAGRAYDLVKLNRILKGTASAPGYTPRSFSIVCSDVESHEEILKLTKK